MRYYIYSVIYLRAHWALTSVKMLRWTILLVATCMIGRACCQDLQDLVLHKRIQKCGDGLTSALMLICNYEYNKRSSLIYDTGDSDADLMSDGPWRARSRALALMSRPRLKRGVVDECCNKACTIAELSSYCLTEPKLTPNIL